MTRSTPTATERAPSVLAVLVVRDAEAWLRESLSALAAQTYQRLGVMAVDNGSSDGSHDLLVQALGQGRVMALPGDLGLAGALDVAVATPPAREADYVLVLHDDAALDPDAVSRLVEAAVGISGLDHVGVVGAKIVDWDDPRLLRDVGRSADRFGHPHTPLQPGEIDQGQFDRVLEVLCVSSSAMLIERSVRERAGLFDGRIHAGQEEVDFCWRARLAGFRVLMTPLARVRHRHREVPGAGQTRDLRHGSARYEEDRAALAAMLKNHSAASLLWLLPSWLALSLLRLFVLALSRRFEEAFDLLSAWGWNVAHLPGTLRRRRRAQRTRQVKDGSLGRFMETSGQRLPSWFQSAERIWEEQGGVDGDDDGEPRTATRRLRERTTSLLGAHPAILGGFVGALVALVAFRNLIGPGRLYGGALLAFPRTPSGFFGELVSAYRTTGVGGSLPGSPALGAMGVLSTLMLTSTALAQKALLIGAPVLAAVLMYRAVVRLTGRPGPAVLAAAAYASSALSLWAISQGRTGLLVALAVLPAAAERFEAAFAPEGSPPDGGWRSVTGLGVTFAVAVAFFPGAILVLMVLLLVQVIAGTARRRGSTLVGGGLLGAAVLLFPFVPTLVAGRGMALGSRVGTTEVGDVARLALGPGPGTWEIAAFVPVAALLAFALTGPELRARSRRAMLAALAGLALTWLSAAGYLPPVLSNPLAYAGLTAVGEALMVGYGLASVLRGLGRESFGLRQIGTAMLAVVLGGGLLLQSVAAMTGDWAVGGPERIPAAWTVVESGVAGEFRVLWMGEGNRPFPPPGGDPMAVASAGDATVRYALTGRGGATALDTGRPLAGPGADALGAAIGEILSGATVHGGALLAPFGVRFLVADSADLPPAAAARLESQVDLDVVPTSGLAIYRNAAELPPASVIDVEVPTAQRILAGRPADVASLGAVSASPMDRVEGGWDGPRRDGLVALSTEHDGAWAILGSGAHPQHAFGWATAFPSTTGPVSVRYSAQLPRTIEMVLLAALWLVALWVTRKPVAR